MITGLIFSISARAAVAWAMPFSFNGVGEWPWIISYLLKSVSPWRAA